MREGMLHSRDVEGPKKTESMEARLEAMEQQVFKCQGMVEHGLNAKHMMITEFTNKHKIDANDIGKHLSRLYDIIDHLQAQIYDLQSQNCGDGHAQGPAAGCSCRTPSTLRGEEDAKEELAALQDEVEEAADAVHVAKNDTSHVE
ncbi:40S ribosomal protein S5-1 [Hordeum vulgare]|nr:40S ribosomal protein S5-1 [Hordeum vulgare]